MFRLEFSTDNAAFGEDEFQRNHEIARILRDIAAKVGEQDLISGSARDLNGNKVGEWEIT
jgi:hypothetical protein